MRACAAVGVVVTHVAFQTAHTGGISGRLFGRFDLAVAVFFALSGFLLWRGHAAAARGLRSRPPTGHYLRSRIVRIMPGYLVAVVLILTLLPDAKADLTVDRKSTRLNSSHSSISYAVFCLKKKRSNVEVENQ